jgi:hypothetical protein
MSGLTWLVILVCRGIRTSPFGIGWHISEALARRRQARAIGPRT